ncbi:MAG: twin-arginine translocase subunit TatC [Bacteroidota bacterium]|nr:twin-arginine translocase subunit TatC [Bacteroidota bacterium]
MTESNKKSSSSKETEENKKVKEHSEMTFLEHLEELRWHIIRSLLAAIVFTVVAFIEKNILFDYIIFKPTRPDFATYRFFSDLGKIFKIDSLNMSPKAVTFKNLEMAGQFTTHIEISFVAGLIMACPYILYEFWKFISPALYPNERKNVTSAAFVTSFLFLLGVAFGYYVILPMSFQFVMGYEISSAVENTFLLSSYMSMLCSIALSTGVVFELPVLSFFLSKVGILKPALMRNYRRYAYVILLFIAAIITPPDVVSQILVSLPLIILYEISIYISARINKKREAAES